MPVQISDGKARQIASKLKEMDAALEAEYGTGDHEARTLAEVLQERAGPPREPIRQWVKDNKHRFVVPSDHGGTVESVVDEIVEAIEQSGDQQ